MHLLSVILIQGQHTTTLYSTIPSFDDSITILFAGDIMGHMPQIHAAYDSNDKSYNFSPCFKYIQSVIKQADIAIANLETTLAGPPYSGYPLFSSPDELARDTYAAGFHILATANNHCYDKGKEGMERTIKVLDSLGITRIGTYLNLSDRNKNYPLIIEKNGIKIAFFNYTYSTNGIPVNEPNIVNLIDRNQMIKDINKADSLGAHIKIFFLHWGVEYALQPNLEQQNLAKFLASNGVDIIVGSHPHVIQTFEFISDTFLKKTVPVFYSLGNFVSNQRDPYRDGGALSIFVIRYNKNTPNESLNQFNISPYYIPYWVFKGSLHGKYQYYVLPLPEALNFSIPDEDKKKMNDHYIRTKEQLKNIPQKITSTKVYLKNY